MLMKWSEILKFWLRVGTIFCPDASGLEILPPLRVDLVPMCSMSPYLSPPLPPQAWATWPSRPWRASCWSWSQSWVTTSWWRSWTRWTRMAQWPSTLTVNFIYFFLHICFFFFVPHLSLCVTPRLGHTTTAIKGYLSIAKKVCFLSRKWNKTTLQVVKTPPPTVTFTHYCHMASSRSRFPNQVPVQSTSDLSGVGGFQRKKC